MFTIRETDMEATFNRRDFFKCTGAFAGLALAGCSTVPPRRTEFGPGDKLRHACIGVGGMGFNDFKNFLSHPRVEVVAICDVDSNHLANAAKVAPQARKYADWRELLEKEDIDGALVGGASLKADSFVAMINSSAE